MRVIISSIRDMLANNQEDMIRSYIETYSCETEKEDGTKKSLNPDIERFLSSNAIQFARMKTAMTYLVIDEEDGALLGYFSLAHKPLEIPAGGIPRKIKDKIKSFSSLDEENDCYSVSAFLIGQFGKNYAVDNGRRISGTELMNIAIEKLRSAQNIVGGTIAYLDCEADAELIQFYESQKFTLFGERISDNDGKRYLQYLNFV